LPIATIGGSLSSGAGAGRLEHEARGRASPSSTGEGGSSRAAHRPSMGGIRGEGRLQLGAGRGRPSSSVPRPASEGAPVTNLSDSSWFRALRLATSSWKREPRYSKVVPRDFGEQRDEDVPARRLGGAGPRLRRPRSSGGCGPNRSTSPERNRSRPFPGTKRARIPRLGSGARRWTPTGAGILRPPSRSGSGRTAPGCTGRGPSRSRAVAVRHVAVAPEARGRSAGRGSGPPNCFHQATVTGSAEVQTLAAFKGLGRLCPGLLVVGAYGAGLRGAGWPAGRISRRTLHPSRSWPSRALARAGTERNEVRSSTFTWEVLESTGRSPGVI